ncbi:MAG: MFS transporter [Chloroflexi bacterium]|nr:MFS transporter [Chloroflexota bacterium]
MSLVKLSRQQASPWAILAIICLPVFIGALDLTIISAVLPEVIVSLDLPVKEYLDQASWAVNGYLLAYAISMTFTGRLSDIVGRRTIYLGCLLVFIAGSYLVTMYDNPTINSNIGKFYYQVLDRRPPRLEERYLYLVITGRIIQALGAGAMVPVTLALVGDLFPPHQRAKPLGIVGAVDTMGWVLGHLYGGVMVRFFGEYGDNFVDAFGKIGLTIATPSWETLFILNIPLSVLALFGAWWALRGLARPQGQGRFDILGTLFITLALIGLNLGLGASPESAGSAESFEDLQGSASHYGFYLLMGAALAFMLFLLVETRIKHPLIRLSMFRNRNLSASSAANFLVGFCLAIGLVSAPLLVNFRVKDPDSENIKHAAYITGLLLSGLTVPMAVSAVYGGWLSDRRGYRFPTSAGLTLATGGFILTGLFWETDTSYWIMALQMAVIGVGLGMTISPIGTAVINAVNEHERGVASALILILRLVGMTVAISSLTIFSLERFDSLVAQYVDPAATTLEEITKASSKANLKAAVRVINEMQFIGAGISGLGLLVSLLLRGQPESAAVMTSQEQG